MSEAGAAIALTKAQILRGKTRTEPFEIELEVDGELQLVELALRPLTDGEAAEVEARMLGGQSVIAERETEGEDGDARFGRVRMDLATFIAGDYQADSFAAACGLTHGKETWSVKDVQALRPNGSVKKIAAQVYAISGVTPEGKAEVESFREELGGATPGEPAPAGDPALTDAG